MTCFLTFFDSLVYTNNLKQLKTDIVQILFFSLFIIVNKICDFTKIVIGKKYKKSRSPQKIFDIKYELSF